jgi:hypothetical protein
MASLGPLRCYIGKDFWSGYVVLEFSASDCVVLECPFEGNATYVLFWRLEIDGEAYQIRNAAQIPSLV